MALLDWVVMFKAVFMQLLIAYPGDDDCVVVFVMMTMILLMIMTLLDWMIVFKAIFVLLLIAVNIP